MLPARDRVTAHYCEAMREADKTQRCAKTHGQAARGERGDPEPGCARARVCVFGALKTKESFHIHFPVTLPQDRKVH